VKKTLAWDAGRLCIQGPIPPIPSQRKPILIPLASSITGPFQPTTSFEFAQLEFLIFFSVVLGQRCTVGERRFGARRNLVVGRELLL